MFILGLLLLYLYVSFVIFNEGIFIWYLFILEFVGRFSVVIGSVGVFKYNVLD